MEMLEQVFGEVMKTFPQQEDEGTGHVEVGSKDRAFHYSSDS